MLESVETVVQVFALAGVVLYAMVFFSLRA